MKKSISMLVAVLLLCSCLFVTAPSVSAATKTEETRAIAIVFDNSGSMYINGEQAWCRATYAMEVFASMLNAGDVLQIYPMHAISVGGKNYDMDHPLSITDAAKASTIRDIFTEDAQGTPVETIDKAAEGLKKLKADKKTLIVLTDGDVFYKNDVKLSPSDTKAQLDSRFKELTAEGLPVMYLGVGKKVIMPDTKESQLFVKKKAADSADTLSTLTEMCNQIFGRDSIPASHLSSRNLKLDMSISKLIVFVQGENISDLKVTGKSGSVGKIQSTATTKYSTAGCGNYKSVPDKSLQGMMVTYTDFSAGNYTIEFSGKESSIEVYYEPDADLDFVFTDSEGNMVDPEELYEGEYKVSFGMKDAKTGQLISSELLGSPHYDGKYFINGVETAFSHDGYSGEVDVSLKMNDSFDANLTVKYLSGYTIKKTSADFGWPEGGIKVASRPAGDLKLKITGGDTAYPLQNLEKGKPFIAEVYYQGTKLTGKELESVDLRWEANTSYAEIKKEFADDHYKLTLHYKDPNAPADTVCGRCKVTINANYAAKGSERSRAKATLNYKINDDFAPVKVDLFAPDDYIVISDLDKSDEVVATLSKNGKPLTAEEFKAVELKVDCSGIEHKITPNAQESSYLIKLLPTEKIAEDDYKISVVAKYTDNIGRVAEKDDSVNVTLSNTPLWLKWLIGLLAILLLTILIILICRIRVLPSKMSFLKKNSRMILDGDDKTSSAPINGGLSKKQVDVFCKYKGTKAGIAMNVKPGKESFLCKPREKKYAEIVGGVHKVGTGTITDVSIGTSRFVLDENTKKLVLSPPSNKAIIIRHNTDIRYSGTMYTEGSEKPFTVTTKVDLKKK